SKRLFRDLSQLVVLGVPLWIEGVVIGMLILVKESSSGIRLKKTLSSVIQEESILTSKQGEKISSGHSTQKDSFRMTNGDDDLAYLERFAAVVAPFLRNVQKIQQYFAPPIRENTLLQKYEAIGLLGRSKPFIELLHAVEAAARCDVRVLLEGQSGTGKEMIARAIHQFSARSNAPFVAIDCGAIPENLVESELFGHVKGAFTGAISERKGLITEADKGTLFMDEIANLPTDIQSKLMRVLQEGEIRPIGSNTTRKVDVRVIAAGSVSLRKLVAENKFREDLYYRLHVYPIQVPPLHERQEDIPILANHFLAKFASQQGKKAQVFHEEIMDFMRHRQWIGNIRELENFVERLVTLSPPGHTILGRSILPKDLLKELKRAADVLQDQHVTQSLNESMAEYEEKIIRQALANHNWNQAKTARLLKISDETLRYKMKKLGIVRSNA
ncbi:MAG: sigma-54 interaction domain-containing protein, partial [bacterium]